MRKIFKSHCRNTLCQPVQHMKRIALMHKTLNILVPETFVFVACQLPAISQKSLISVLESKSLVPEGQVLVLALTVLVLVLESCPCPFPGGKEGKGQAANKGHGPLPPPPSDTVKA